MKAFNSVCISTRMYGLRLVPSVDGIWRKAMHTELPLISFCL